MREDYVGKKFGHWTVLEKTEQRNKYKNFLYWVQCDCPLKTKKLININNLKKHNNCFCVNTGFIDKVFGRLTVVEQFYDRHSLKCKCN